MIKKNILNYFNKSPRHGQKASPSQIVGFSDWTDEKRAHELPSSSRRNARKHHERFNNGKTSSFRVHPRARVTLSTQRSAFDPLTIYQRLRRRKRNEAKRGKDFKSRSVVRIDERIYERVGTTQRLANDPLIPPAASSAHARYIVITKIENSEYATSEK